jgi:MFS family permease
MQLYKYYALGAMTAVYTVSLLDRGLMVMLLEPIKRDLQLTDTQLGLLTGIAFGFFYATLGVPIARWADRGNRATISSLAIGLWGLTVISCVLVTNFFQLVLARVSTAVGEAGCKPPAYSLLATYFPDPAQRTRAMYLFVASPSFAGLISMTAAGWLNEQYGWRIAFFIVGIPGLLLAVLFKLTIVDPRMRRDARYEQTPAPPMNRVLKTMWGQRACRHMTIAMILTLTMGHGLGPWIAAFMMRSHGIGTAELGLWLGVVLTFCGLAGMLLGTYVMNRWFADREQSQLRLQAIAVALATPFFAVFLLIPDKELALQILIPQSALITAFAPSVYVLFQRLVPDEMRATMLAVMMLLANLVGMGCGPLIVGMVSDALTPSVGVDSLRYAMVLMSSLAAWAGLHYWLAAKTVKRDLEVAIPQRELGCTRTTFA